ncbi:MAG: sigma 54-interacting transcriptional regulator [Deltaproteobacteria bacterium]|nr:sigma 54-interacting transcriptional regulator [Deltaproteobacteria bacterium]
MLFARRYQLGAALGRGGSGTTWRAKDVASGADVAIKMLDLPGAEAAEAFVAEFARLAGLAHENLVEVLDHGVARDASGASRHFIAAALVRGRPLGDATGEVTDVVTPLGDALHALAYLHRSGIRHGDFKPGNIVVRDDGRGVLLDLGAAAPLGRPAGARLSGTPRYLAPEVLAGQPLDARADLFAVGVTLTTLAERSGGKLPSSTEELARALSHPNRERRPRSVAEVLAALGVVPTAEVGRAVSAAPRTLGRHEETAVVRLAIERLVAGEPGPRAVSILGAEGAGKSRFLREVRWMAQSRVPVVVEGLARGRDAVQSMLARAAAPERDDEDRSSASGPQQAREGSAQGLESAIAAHASIVERGLPTVLLLDDANAVSPIEGETLRALLRLLRPTDPLMVVVAEMDGSTGQAVSEIGAPGVLRRIELAPLAPRDVAEWFPELATAEVERIVRWTGGIPGAIAEIAPELANPDLDRSHLGVTSSSERRAEAARALPEAARLALAVLSVWGEPLGSEAVAALGVSESALWSAHAARLAARDHGSWRLERASDAEVFPRAVGESCLALARARVLDWSGRDERGTFDASKAARRARVLVEMGDDAGAIEALSSHRASWPAAPIEWARVARAIVARARPTDVEARLSAAEVLEAAGAPAEALGYLSATAIPPSATQRIRVAVAKASCLMKLGRPEDVIAELTPIESDPSGTSAVVRARAADLRSRALVKLGDYEGALRVAREGLSTGIADPSIRGDLLEDAGVAASYLGRHEDAGRALAEATACQSAAASPRRECRAQICWAIDDYRAGRIESAIERYRVALATAEKHQLDDLVASTSLNLGSALHQRGEWGEALRSYARGGRIAAALGQTDVAVVLAFDLAKLHADIGSLGEAERALRRARELAVAAESRFFAAACDDLDGEIRVMRDGSGGGAAFRAAERGFVEMGATREAAEVRLHLAELAAKTDVRDARRWLDAAAADASKVAARDLDVRVAIVRAIVELAAGDAEPARRALESARSIAGNDEVGLVRAELEWLLAQAWERDGAEVLAGEHRRRARAAWERTAAGLPHELREVFWQHPRRRGLERALRSADVRGEKGRGGREAKLERLLAVNRLLASTLESGEVLRRTMDAAIEITGAERGFLILARGGSLEVAVARNVDRERVGRSQWKFSHSIAERVIETGEPIVTADAASDERFSGEESVHAMRLRSVAAVPIRGPEEVLGALYLDNRFQPSRFDVTDVDLLTAFADQVAIALRNAEMHEALQRRTEELEREKARVEAALRGQEQRIEALTEEVRTSREALARRYDYGEIVGRSAAMHRVLATLDRVIDSGLSVLVQGESGTGKELVARAIHVHSPRASGPFVGINCAALPESLLESELFGHVRGAFTGADRDRPGLMVAARGGTLFLDEIGEMPMSMQAKLLRALQEREVRPIGSAAAVPVDFRLVCATNRALREEAEQGRFRRDLYYRVGVVEVTLPPLRERSEDVPAIAARVLERLGRELGKTTPRLSPRAMQALMAYAWPGNVRELENVLAKAAITAESDEIGVGDLDLRARRPEHLPARRRATEKEELLEALARSGGHAGKAARALGVSRATFYRRLTALGIARG